jgi:thioredoxin 2
MPVIRSCPACGVSNRIPVAHLADEGRCGACKSALPPIAVPLDADVARFDEVVGGASVPVLVDFWAAWCSPCRMAAPEVERAAQNLAGRAVVLKVDTERYPQIAARFGVQSIPNFVVLRGGRVVRQQPGLVGHLQLEEWARAAGDAQPHPQAAR